MHMADALLSPAVGGTMWAAGGAALAYSSRKTRHNLEEGFVPLMGVMGAFVFAVQMINFTIPGTGSSGHLSGGLLLAVLLGPHGGFLAMASILTIQALFFADGGLLALGANIFNLGFFPCFIAYPLLYRPLAGTAGGRGRLMAGSLLAAVAALQLGSLAVVLETVFSGMTALSFASFATLMQPIHLAVGLVEGVVTAMVIALLREARPEMVEQRNQEGKRAVPGGRMLAALGLVALLIGTLLVRFASPLPDGLEWSLDRLDRATHGEIEVADGGIHGFLGELQDKVAWFPDYRSATPPSESLGRIESGKPAGPAVSPASGLAGLAGGMLTLALLVLVGLGLLKKNG